MPLTTRKPTGLAPWPVILLAGRPKAGKSWTAAEFSASQIIDRTFWIEVGETTADQYGAIPGARYEIVDHTGTYASIRQAIKDACDEPGDLNKPNAIVVDSFGRIWELLSDEAQVMANRREAAKAAKFKKATPDPDADFTVGTDLWNRAKKRWYELLRMLQAYPGPVILLSRLDEATVMSPAGEPTKDKVWKTKAQKDLVFDVDVVVEARRFRDWQLTGVRSVTYALPESGLQAIPEFTVEKLLIGLGVTKHAGTRNAVHLDPDAVDPATPAASTGNPAATAPVTLPDDFAALVADAEARLDRDELLDYHALAKESGNQLTVAKVAAAGKRVAQAVTDLRKKYDTNGAQHTVAELLEFATQDAAQAVEAAAAPPAAGNRR